MRTEFADVLDRFASLVIELPGVSRSNPHAFAEGKDELARAMQRRASEYRARDHGAGREAAAAGGPFDAIRPGARRIGGRRVAVEVRGGRRP